MTTSIDRLDDLLFKIGTGTGGSYAELIDLAADAVSEVRRGTSPQIIHTVEELEGLESPTWLMGRDGFPVAAGQLLRAIREYGPRFYLPAVVIVPAEQVHTALEALEEA